MGNERHLPTANEIMREVTVRNTFRSEFNLPPIDLEAELRKGREARDGYAFQRWMSHPIRQRVEAKLLHRLRRKRNDPEWRPTGVLSGGGLYFHVKVNEQMRKLRNRLGDRWLDRNAASQV